MRENANQGIKMSVKEMRIQRGWSQEHLAQVSGLSIRTIQRVEGGRRAGFETLKSLAAVFETDLNRIRQEPRMNAPSTTTPALEKDLAEEYILNIKAYKINFFTYIFIMPLLFILNTVLTPGFLWVMIVFFAWGMSFVLHGMVIKVLYGIFDLNIKRPELERHFSQNS